MNITVMECSLHCIKKISGQWEKSGIKYSTGSTLQTGQTAEQGTGTDNRQSGGFTDNLRRLFFQYAIVPCAVNFTDGTAFHIGKPFLCMRTQEIPVRFLKNLSGDGGLTGQIPDIIRVGKTIIRTKPLDALAVNAHQEQPRTAEFAFYTGIGRQCGGQTGNRSLPAQLRVKTIQCFQNAAGQVIIGG